MRWNVINIAENVWIIDFIKAPVSIDLNTVKYLEDYVNAKFK